MRVSARRTDLFFEDTFKGLAFEVAEQRNQLARLVYQGLLPLVPLSAADIRVIPADNYRDAKFLATAANGLFRIELSAEQMLIAFTSLPGEFNLQAAWQFAGLVEGAVRSVLPIERVLNRSVRRSSHVAAAEEGFDADVFLRRLVSADAHTAAAKNGTDAVSFGFQTTLTSGEGGWSVRLFLERSLLPETALFFQSTVLFGEGKIPPPEEALSLSATKTRDVLSNLGLELA